MEPKYVDISTGAKYAMLDKAHDFVVLLDPENNSHRIIDTEDFKREFKRINYREESSSHT